MKYEGIEDLPVWKASIDFTIRMYDLTGGPAFKGRFSLRDQIERAAVSISNNIAEGFERGTTQELLTFLTSLAARLAKSGLCFACLNVSLPSRI